MLKEKIKAILIKINALSHEVNEEQFKTLKAISNELKDCYEIAKEWEENVLIAPRKKEPLYAIYPNPMCERCGDLIVGNLMIDGTVYVCCRERNCKHLGEEHPTEYVTTSGDPIILRFLRDDAPDMIEKAYPEELKKESAEGIPLSKYKDWHLGM